MRKEIDWNGKEVLEAGTGTGRVTDIYIELIGHAFCCDRSQHMLNYAKNRLAEYQAKIEFIIADNLHIPKLDHKVDIFVEGWSFGHTVSDGENETDINRRIHTLVENATENVVKRGSIIMIESLGTNVDTPEPPTAKLAIFQEKLVSKYDFQKAIVRTDYGFKSKEDAETILGFFFGNDQIPEIKARNSEIIPKWTGVWIKSIN